MNVLKNLSLRRQEDKKTNNLPPWMNKPLLRLIRKKRIWKKFNKYGSLENKTKYENIERQVKNQIRNTKKNFERKLAKETKKIPRCFIII